MSLRVLMIASHAVGSTAESRGVNGPELRTLNLIPHFKRLGIQPVVAYSRSGRLWDRFSSEDIELYQYDFRGALHPQSYISLLKIIVNAKANILHTQGPPSLDLVAVLLAKALGRRACITRPSMILERGKRLRDRIYNAIDRITLALADRVIAVSDDGATKLKLLGVDSKKLVIVKNGVDTDVFSPGDTMAGSADQAYTSSSLLVCGVGQLTVGKYWGDFLSCASAVIKRSDVDVAFSIVGTGPCLHELKTRSAELDISGVVSFDGFDERIEERLRRATVVLMMSRREGLPVALLEAASVGVPIVSTDVGAISEIVHHGCNGYLVSVGDVEAATERVLSLLGDESMRRSFSEYSRRLILSGFTIQQMADGYAKVYSSI